MNGRFLIPIILKISEINVGVFSHLGFSGSWDPPSPPPGGRSRGPKNPKVEKLKYCNTIKIILYKIVIIFHQNLFKILKHKVLKKYSKGKIFNFVSFRKSNMHGGKTAKFYCIINKA